jgi:hypothetical protein
VAKNGIKERKALHREAIEGLRKVRYTCRGSRRGKWKCATIKGGSAIRYCDGNSANRGIVVSYRIYKVNRKNIFCMRKVLLRGQAGLFAEKETFGMLKI